MSEGAEAKASNMVSNDHGVTKKQWAKWSCPAQRAFNGVYYAMTESPWLFHHPDADPVPEEHWKTVAWNAAWLAAEAVDGK